MWYWCIFLKKNSTLFINICIAKIHNLHKLKSISIYWYIIFISFQYLFLKLLPTFHEIVPVCVFWKILFLNNKIIFFPYQINLPCHISHICHLILELIFNFFVFAEYNEQHYSESDYAQNTKNEPENWYATSIFCFFLFY